MDVPVSWRHANKPRCSARLPRLYLSQTNECLRATSHSHDSPSEYQRRDWSRLGRQFWPFSAPTVCPSSLVAPKGPPDASLSVYPLYLTHLPLPQREL